MSRSAEQLKRHYEIERELADRLRRAPAEERLHLYAAVYDELFRRVPDHPQLTRDAAHHDAWVAGQTASLRRFLTPETTFLEIGAGDCALSLEVARIVRHVYALDVSEEIVHKGERPPNVEVVLSDGRSIPVPQGSVDVAYSNQLMEHLHPDDAAEQLSNIHAALRPGGIYVCVTPHRFTGPHDISRRFDEVATGFHLKEYTNSELIAMFRSAGFASVRSRLEHKGFQALVPTAIATTLEGALARMPAQRRRAVAGSPLRKLMGISLVARK